MAQHITASMKKRVGEEEAERIGWATVNARKKKGGIGMLRRGGKGGPH